MSNIIILALFIIVNQAAFATDKQLLTSEETCGPRQVFVYLETLEYTACLLTRNSEMLGRKHGILISLQNISNKPITIFLPNEKSREFEQIVFISEHDNPNSVRLYPPGPPADDSGEPWLFFVPVQLAKNAPRYYKLYFKTLAPDINRRLRLANNPEISSMRSFIVTFSTRMGFLREGEIGKDFQAFQRRREEYRQLLKEGQIKPEYIFFNDVKINWENQ